MKAYIEEYRKYAQNSFEQYTNEAKFLEADGRSDEGNLLKVRANICDIFITMLSATEKKVAAKKITDSMEMEKLYKEEYLKFFYTIPRNWLQRLELAEKNGDTTNSVIEKIKLETANMLKGEFLRLAGDTND